MKSIKSILTLILFVPMIFAGTTEETYLKAHAIYNAGDSTKALSLYQSIEPKGPGVWYNIGNCYFCQEKFPEAIVAWRRAQKGISWSDYKITEQYIAGAYNRLGIDYSTSGIKVLYSFLFWLMSHISLLIWQLLFLICWFFCLLLFHRLLSQKKYFKLALLSLLACAVAIICYARYYNQTYPLGIVTKKSISVYAGPGRDYAPLATAQMLEMMRLKLQRDGWLKVYVHQFGYGWVHAGDLELI